jgi:hypothetical protein
VRERRGLVSRHANRTLTDVTRRSLRVGIDKNGKGTLAERLSEFRGELVAAQDLNIASCQRRDQTPRGVPTKSIVTTKRVPVTDDESPGSEVRRPKSKCQPGKIRI